MTDTNSAITNERKCSWSVDEQSQCNSLKTSGRETDYQIMDNRHFRTPMEGMHVVYDLGLLTSSQSAFYADSEELMYRKSNSNNNNNNNNTFRQTEENYGIPDKEKAHHPSYKSCLPYRTPTESFQNNTPSFIDSFSTAPTMTVSTSACRSLSDTSINSVKSDLKRRSSYSGQFGHDGHMSMGFDEHFKRDNQNGNCFLQVPDFGYFCERKSKRGTEKDNVHSPRVEDLRFFPGMDNERSHRRDGSNSSISSDVSIKVEYDSAVSSPASCKLSTSPCNLSPSPGSPSMDCMDLQADDSMTTEDKVKYASDSRLFYSPSIPSPLQPLTSCGLQEPPSPSGMECHWKACSQSFVSQKALAQHVNDEHVRVERPDMDFRCHWQGCSRQGKGFNARYKMLIHIRTHTNEKPHKCSICGKCFSRLENLKIHMRSHTGEKPYMCTFPGCNKAYSNSSDRFKHVRTHQEEKPYKCKMPGCPKQYTDPSSLRKHVRTHGHAVVEGRRTPDCTVQRCKSFPDDSIIVKQENELHYRRYSIDVSGDFTQKLMNDAEKQMRICQNRGSNSPMNIPEKIDLYESLEIKNGIQQFSQVENCLTDHSNSLDGTLNGKESQGPADIHVESKARLVIDENVRDETSHIPMMELSLHSQKPPMKIPSIVVEEVNRDGPNPEKTKKRLAEFSYESNDENLRYDKKRRHSHNTLYTLGSSLDEELKDTVKTEDDHNDRSQTSLSSLKVNAQSDRPRSMPSTASSPPLVAKHWKKRKLHDEEMQQLLQKSEKKEIENEQSQIHEELKKQDDFARNESNNLHPEYTSSTITESLPSQPPSISGASMYSKHPSTSFRPINPETPPSVSSYSIPSPSIPANRPPHHSFHSSPIRPLSWSSSYSYHSFPRPEMPKSNVFDRHGYQELCNKRVLDSSLDTPFQAHGFPKSVALWDPLSSPYLSAIMEFSTLTPTFHRYVPHHSLPFPQDSPLDFSLYQHPSLSHGGLHLTSERFV